MKAGVVAALIMEARALGPGRRRPDGLTDLDDGTLVALGGMGCAGAAAAAQTLADAGAGALMSFGLAGGLDPSLPAGSIVVPDEVISRDGARFASEAQWRERLTRALRARTPADGCVTVAGGTLLTCPRTLDTPADKAAAFRETGALAVDMESIAVAQVAAQRRLPFLTVRVIVDSAADELPRAVLTASRDGQVRLWRLLGGLAVGPADLPGVLRLACRYQAAKRSLAVAARALRAAPPAELRAA